MIPAILEALGFGISYAVGTNIGYNTARQFTEGHTNSAQSYKAGRWKRYYGVRRYRRF